MCQVLGVFLVAIERRNQLFLYAFLFEFEFVGGSTQRLLSQELPAQLVVGMGVGATVQLNGHQPAESERDELSLELELERPDQLNLNEQSDSGAKL